MKKLFIVITTVSLVSLFVFTQPVYCADSVEKPNRAALMKAANQGNVLAQYYLGLDYYRAKNYPSAFQWFTLASKQGDPLSQFMQAYMYYKGFGVEKNYNKAYILVKPAAEKGNIFACALLGNMYFSGQGVTKNYPDAAKYFNLVISRSKVVLWTDNTRAQATTITEAQYKLAYMYYKGLGVTKNNKKAMELASISAKHGSSEAKKLVEMMKDDISKINQNVKANELN